MSPRWLRHSFRCGSASPFSLPLSALVLEPRRGVRCGAAARLGCGGACVCVLCGGSLASLYRGGCRQESAAGELEVWTVCPPLSCQWRWLGCSCCDGGSRCFQVRLVAPAYTSSLLPLSLEFLLLWLVRDWLSLLSLVREAHPPYFLQEFVAGRLWWLFFASCVANSVSCEHERLFRSELRVAFLQVLG
ncbi:hypothetical protein Taro_026632, partial [Colocasia esculenta]|nr:hypothetical protein [Colocasia esculenta]